MTYNQTAVISDQLWALVQPLIPGQLESRDLNRRYCRKSGGGRKPKYSNRIYFTAIVYVLQTGINWKKLPREMFGGICPSSVHYKYRQWVKAGFFDRLWNHGFSKYTVLYGFQKELHSRVIDHCTPLSEKETTSPISNEQAIIDTKQNASITKYNIQSPVSSSETNTDESDTRGLLPKDYKTNQADSNGKPCLVVKAEEQGNCLQICSERTPVHNQDKNSTALKNALVCSDKYRVIEYSKFSFSHFRKLVPSFLKKTANFNALLTLTAALIMFDKMVISHGALS